MALAGVTKIGLTVGGLPVTLRLAEAGVTIAIPPTIGSDPVRVNSPAPGCITISCDRVGALPDKFSADAAEVSLNI